MFCHCKGSSFCKALNWRRHLALEENPLKRINIVFLCPRQPRSRKKTKPNVSGKYWQWYDYRHTQLLCFVDQSPASPVCGKGFGWAFLWYDWFFGKQNPKRTRRQWPSQLSRNVGAQKVGKWPKTWQNIQNVNAAKEMQRWQMTKQTDKPKHSKPQSWCIWE